MFTKLLLRFRSDMDRASQFWAQTSNKSTIFRIVYVFYRILRCVIYRSRDASRTLKWKMRSSVDAYRYANMRSLLSSRTPGWRGLGRHIWRSMAHSLFAILRLAKGRAKSLFYTYKSRIMQSYNGPIRLLKPVNYMLSIVYRPIKYKNSVLHISYMVHIPYETTRILRKQGIKADYLAMEKNPAIWDKSDYLFVPHHVPFIRAMKEFIFFWTVMAKYEIIHCHFAMMLSNSGWELPVLKRMGRKIVIHYRGCEIRHREKNMALHPDMNICQACDYNAVICRDPARRARCALAEQYGDLFLVTTPDMQDFVPEAIHFPFFAPDIDYQLYAGQRQKRVKQQEIKIVHVTAHPGIEGTPLIQKALDHLKAKGYAINFVYLHLVHHEHVLQEIASADLTIGKMKMGYYANAQIESMFLGVPAITYVRPEFMTPELENSGFIFTHLKDLESTLEYYLSQPEALEQKRQIARSSILRLHDNERLGQQLVALYAQLRTTTRTPSYSACGSAAVQVARATPLDG